MEESSQKEKLSHLSETYKEIKNQLVAAEEFRRKVMSALFVVNKKMKKRASRKGKLAEKMMVLQSEIKDIAKRVATLEVEINEQKDQMRDQLRTLYVLGGQGTMRILFSSTSAHDLDRNLKFLKILSEINQETITHYQKTVKSLKLEREELKGKVKKLLVVRSEVKLEEQKLKDQHQSKAQLLSKLKGQKRKHITALRKLRKQTKSLKLDEINEALEELFVGSFFEKKNRLSPPVEGILSQPFGLLQHPEYRFLLTHKGVFYTAQAGEDVVGVYEGKVAFVGALPGYGQTVILDHGDHYYTVYGHNSEVVVKLGEKIKARQVIAKVGMSSQWKQSGLYFEVRHFSEAEDPMSWMRHEGVSQPL